MEQTFEHMATLPATRVSRRQSSASRSARDATRFDRRLGHILDHATRLSASKDEGASMRDLLASWACRSPGFIITSIQERVLFLIKRHLHHHSRKPQSPASQGHGPEQRIRIFIKSSQYFVSDQQGLKVLSHEDESLKNGLAGIAASSGKYYLIAFG